MLSDFNEWDSSQTNSFVLPYRSFVMSFECSLCIANNFIPMILLVSALRVIRRDTGAIELYGLDNVQWVGLPWAGAIITNYC